MAANSEQQPSTSSVQATASEPPQQAASGPASTGAQPVQPKAAATGLFAGFQWTSGSGGSQTFGSGAASRPFGSVALQAPGTLPKWASSSFGQQPVQAPPSTTASFPFGQQPVQAPPSTTASFPFGQQPVQAPPSTTASFPFGQQPAQAPPSTTASFPFGQQPGQPPPSTQANTAAHRPRLITARGQKSTAALAGSPSGTSPISLTIAPGAPTSAALPPPSTAAGSALTCLGYLPVALDVSQADSTAICKPFARPDLVNRARPPQSFLCSH